MTEKRLQELKEKKEKMRVYQREYQQRYRQTHKTPEKELEENESLTNEELFFKGFEEGYENG